MTYEYGTVRQVVAREVGASIATAAAVTDVVLQLDDSSIFADTGGHVLIDDTAYAYTSADHDADTLTLSTGLLVALEEGESVLLYDDSSASTFTEHIAHVELEPAGDGDDAVEAHINHALIPYLPEGIRNNDGEAVALEKTGATTYRLVDIIRQTPNMDGTVIDPDSLPEPEPSDGNPPSAAPSTVTVTPLGFSGLMIRWSAVGNADPVRYKVYLDTVDPPVQELNDTAGLLTATSILPDGTDLALETDYYAMVVPYDEDGTGPSSTVVSSQIITVPADAVSEDVMIVNEFFARDSYLGTVSVDQLTAGELVAAIAILGALHLGSAISMTPDNGIVVHTPDGDTVIPADGSRIRLNAEAVLAAATILGSLAIRGSNNEVSKGATVTLETGTTNPTVTPSVSTYMPSKPIHEGFNPRGFAAHPMGGNRYLTTDSLLDGFLFGTLESSVGDFDDGSFAYSFWIVGLATDLGRSEVVNAYGGVAVIGSDAYMLCETNETIAGSGGKSEWYIYKLHWDGPNAEDWSYVTRWRYRPGDSGINDSIVLGGYSPYRPAIGTDGFNLWTAQGRSTTGRLYMARYTTTGTLSDRHEASEEGGGAFIAKRDARGVVGGSFDLGDGRIMVTYDGRSTAYAFDTDVGVATRVVDDSFNTGTSDQCGILWDGTRFRVRTSTDVLSMSTIIDTDLAANPVSAAYTWRKADLTGPDFAEFETAAGPETTTASLLPRWWIRVSTPTIPDDAGDADDPDSISVYLARGGSPINTDFHLAATPAAGVNEVDLETIPTATGNPPTTNGFGAGTPAAIVSAASDLDGPLVQIHGDGSHRLDPDGNLDDTGWVAFDSGVGEAPFATATENRCEYRRIGKLVEVRISKATNASRDNSGNTTGNLADVNVTAVGALPAEVRPTDHQAVGACYLDHSPTTAALTTGGTIVWTGGYPRLYGSGTLFFGSFVYLID